MEQQTAVAIINQETKLPILNFKTIFITEKIESLAKALSEAQGEMSDPSKNSNNPYFNSKYADLSEVLGMIRPAFSKVGLCMTQHPSVVYYEKGAMISVLTMVIHLSGQVMASTLEMSTGTITPQAIGGCITYARRYSAAAIAGISQQDDDGNAATHGMPPNQPNQNYQQQPQNTASKKSAKIPPAPPQNNQPPQIPPQQTPPPANTQGYVNPPQNTQPPAPQHQLTPAEIEHNNRIAKFTKLQSFAARNEWFCNKNEQYPNGRFGISEIFKTISGNANASKDTVTEEQLDYSISLCEFIMNYFEKGGAPDAGPVNLWVMKMLGFMKDNIDPLKTADQSKAKGSGIPF